MTTTTEISAVEREAPASDIPEATCKGLTFWPVPEFSGADIAFGAKREAYFDRHDRPKVPQKYQDIADSLFFRGGRLPDDLGPEVDRAKATGAVRAWLCSFAPAHEAKISTVAYALWLWCSPEAIAKAEGR